MSRVNEPGLGAQAGGDVDDPLALFQCPLPVAGKRDGGYAQIAYRPTQADVDFLRNLELIFRWDHLSRAPSGLGAPEITKNRFRTVKTPLVCARGATNG